MGNENSDRAALFVGREWLLRRIHARHYRRHMAKEKSWFLSLLKESPIPLRCVATVRIDL